MNDEGMADFMEVGVHVGHSFIVMGQIERAFMPKPRADTTFKDLSLGYTSTGRPYISQRSHKQPK